MMDLGQRQAIREDRLPKLLVRIHDDVSGIEQPRLGRMGDRAPSQIGGVIRGCLKGNRCVAATQAYRCAPSELGDVPADVENVR